MAKSKTKGDGVRKPLFDAKADGSVREAVESKSLPCRVTNKDDGTVELLVYGIVGDDWDGMDARSVVETLTAAQGKPLNVRINSPGGLAYDGIAIYNVLAQHKGGVTVTIDGIAGSAASIIALAGDEIRIAETASVYVHRAEGFGIGNSADMGTVAEFLDKLDGQIASAYAARSGKTADEMRALMVGSGDGTTLVGQEAIDAGFADVLVPAKRPKPSESDKSNLLREKVTNRLRMLELDGHEFAGASR